MQHDQRRGPRMKLLLKKTERCLKTTKAFPRRKKVSLGGFWIQRDLNFVSNLVSLLMCVPKAQEAL